MNEPLDERRARQDSVAQGHIRTAGARRDRDGNHDRGSASTKSGKIWNAARIIEGCKADARYGSQQLALAP